MTRWRHPAVVFLLILLAALALAVAERARRQHLAGISEPGRGALWIWAQDVSEGGLPVAFYAVRDIEVTAETPAWLTLVVDESYVLWVNGRRLGSGVHRGGEPADLYDLTQHLQAGWNRLMIEAISSRGAGGILASLRLGTPDRLELASDGSWRIFRRHEAWLARGTRALGPEDGEDPQIWHQPPTGRWRLRDALTLRAGPTRSIEPPPRPQLPVRMRHPVAGSLPQNWRLLDPDRALPHLGPQLVIDFGRHVSGHLEMGLADPSKAALLFFDDMDPPSVDGRTADAVLVTVPGRREWRDPVARRFRYVTLVGARPREWLQVLPAAAPAVRLGVGHGRGVFGLPAPSPFRRAEEAVWGRLQAPEVTGEASAPAP